MPGVEILFTVTICLSSALLFFVQPLVARAILPSLGGTQAVWNTCNVFFQTMLLFGYAYAFGINRRLSARSQSLLHSAFIIFALLVTPQVLHVQGLDPRFPASSLLTWLSRQLGVLFVLLAASAPLIQSWFQKVFPHKEPYPLYAASNTGSLVGLMLYPLFVEPRFGLLEQTQILFVCVALFAALMLGCAVTSAIYSKELKDDDMPVAGAAIAKGRVAAWIVLSFLPSALMLSVTTHITTNISPMPLLWVMPLGIYLISFIIGFSGKMGRVLYWNSRVLPFALLVLVPFLYFEIAGAVIWTLFIHIAAFGIISLAAIGRLHELRPPPASLTKFYLCIAVGGALGGIFVGIVAPLIFNTVLEYPLLVIFSALLVGQLQVSEAISSLRRIVSIQFAAFALTTALFVAIALQLPASSRPLQFLLLFGIPTLVTFSRKSAPLLFFAFFAVTNLSVSSFERLLNASTIIVERDFYGAKRVSQDQKSRFFVHGGTIHGIQLLDPAKRYQPTGYYARSGPVGDVFALMQTTESPISAGIIGLGAGGMAVYAREQDHFDFFELDPQIEELARDERYFTYLAHCGSSCSTAVGDGRLLIEETKGGYSIVATDAFSSDSVPVHLLSKEAVALFLSKLRPGGALLFNVSNRFVDLRLALAVIGHELNLYTLGKVDPMTTVEEGKMPSTFVVLTKNGQMKNALLQKGWSELAPEPGLRVWSDDYSSLWSVLTLRKNYISSKN